MLKYVFYKLSVRLSLLLAIVVVSSLGLIAAIVIERTVRSTEDMVLQEAKTVALSAAAAYSRILEEGIASKELTLKDILDPTYEKMSFTDKDGNSIQVEDARYHTILGDYTDKHGVQKLQDAIMEAGNFLFASGMDRRGYVPTPHAKQSLPPKGNATEETQNWDRKYSRGKRMYDGAEQIAAAGFQGNPKAKTLVQSYLRDTGESAWDVAAPIKVMGQHFGGFRIGVSRDRINAKLHEVTVEFSILFGALTLIIVGSVFILSWTYTRPLTFLSETTDRLSQTTNMEELSRKLVSNDKGEVGNMIRAVNRLRLSLYNAMSMINR